MAPNNWRRPDNVPYPSVWRRFEGRKPTADGKKLKFRVQDLTEDLFEAVADHMDKFFLADEPMCKYINTKGDKVACDEFRAMWLDLFTQRAALVVLLEDDDGNVAAGNEKYPKIVGCNCTGVALKDDDKSPSKKLKGMCTRKIIRACFDYPCELMNVFNHYNIDKYLCALGLSVDPAYRGQGIGAQILRAREPLCRALGLPVTITSFTAIESQTLAERVGFELLLDIPYSEYKEDGEVVFKAMNAKTLKIMGLPYK